MATNKNRTIPLRASPEFDKFIKDIKTNRIRLGKDNPLKPVKTSRITTAITRLPNIESIKQKIIEADLP